MKGAYILADYPDRDLFIREFEYLCRSKVDFIEIGLPFNDPVADGPIIAKASNEVAERGYDIDDIVDVIKLNNSKKIYIMTYANIIYNYGFERFSKRFESILDGVIVADLPNIGHEFFIKNGFSLPLIPFATPESREKDLKKLNDFNGDFVYFIGIRGITGGEVDFKSENIKMKYSEIKSFTDKKVIIGFGVKSVDDVSTILSYADGFVIGTEIVKRQDDFDEFKRYVDKIYF